MSVGAHAELPTAPVLLNPAVSIDRWLARLCNAREGAPRCASDRYAAMKDRIKMDSFAPVEPDTHVFTGTVKAWRSDYGELVTDSGVTVPLVTRGLPALAVGTRLTLVARKFKPLFLIERVVR